VSVNRCVGGNLGVACIQISMIISVRKTSCSLAEVMEGVSYRRWSSCMLRDGRKPNSLLVYGLVRVSTYCQRMEDWVYTGSSEERYRFSSVCNNGSGAIITFVCKDFFVALNDRGWTAISLRTLYNFMVISLNIALQCVCSLFILVQRIEDVVHPFCRTFVRGVSWLIRAHS
jgi:hypothetical protein